MEKIMIKNNLYNPESGCYVPVNFTTDINKKCSRQVTLIRI